VKIVFIAAVAAVLSGLFIVAFGVNYLREPRRFK
jgi:hypothetical protein